MCSKTLKSKLQTFGSAVFLSYLLLPLTVAQAQDVGDVFDNLDENVSRVPKVISYGAYALGVACMIAGLTKLRDYFDDPDRNTLQAALARFGVGAAFIIAPSIMETVLGTLGADGRDFAGGRSGSALYAQ